MCCASIEIHLRCSKHYSTFAQQQIVIGGSQNASLSSVLNNHRPRPGFSDRLTLSNPYTVACFPIKPAQQPLLLLPGTALSFALMFVGILVRAQTLCDCLPRDVFVWKRYRKHSVDHLHQSPTRREMEKGMEDAKRDGGHHRKQHLEKSSGDRRKVDEWMEEPVPSPD